MRGTHDGTGVARAFAHRSFRVFFVGSAAFNVGFWLAHPTMQGLMGDLAPENKGFWVSALFTALFLPAATVSPIAGVFIDRTDRRKALSAAYLFVFGLAMCVALLAGTFNRYTLLIAALFMGTTYAIVAPAQMTAVATAVPAPDIRSAITMQASINNLSRLGAPIASAPLVATRHYREAFLLFAVCALVASFSASRLVLRPIEPSPRIRFTDQLRTGVRHARERPPALTTLVAVSVFSFFGASHVSLLLSFTEDVLHRERGRVRMDAVGHRCGGVSRRAHRWDAPRCPEFPIRHHLLGVVWLLPGRPRLHQVLSTRHRRRSGRGVLPVRQHHHAPDAGAARGRRRQTRARDGLVPSELDRSRTVRIAVLGFRLRRAEPRCVADHRPRRRRRHHHRHLAHRVGPRPQLMRSERTQPNRQ